MVHKKKLGWTKSAGPKLLTVNGNTTQSPLEMAQILNRAYLSRSAELYRNIPKTEIHPMVNFNRLTENNNLNFNFKPVDNNTVLQMLKQINPSMSSSNDGMPMKLISLYHQQLLKSITKMINNTITTQQYPNILKETKIIPLLKPGKPPSDPKSYRGINLSPAISKLIDKTYQTQLTQHLIENDLISQHHHGNVRGTSTTTALLTLLDTWTQALENGKDMLTLLVDQSAAFYIIDHNIFIKKLRSIGLSETSLSLMADYLSNRKQSVCVDTFTSLHCNPMSVIQGSGLSCLFYLIYTLDLPIIFHSKVKTTLEDAVNKDDTEATTYIDDTTVNMTKEDGISMQQTLNDNIYRLNKYMSANKLSMNNDKTKFMIISKEKETYSNVNIPAEPTDIKDSDNIKLLGVEISADMRFNYFLSDSKLSIYKQLTSHLNALKIMKKSTDFNVMRQLANGIFMSKLTYGAEIWVGTPKYLTNKFQHLQLEAARTCIGTKSRYWSKTTLLKEMKWLDVRKRAKFSAIKMIHQILYTQKPALLAARFLSTQESTRPTRLTGAFRLGARPRSVGKSRISAQHFRLTAYNIYKDIPDILKDFPNSNIFKKSLRQYLYNNDDLPENCRPKNIIEDLPENRRPENRRPENEADQEYD